MEPTRVNYRSTFQVLNRKTGFLVLLANILKTMQEKFVNAYFVYRVDFAAASLKKRKSLIILTPSRDL
jgi:hypothetical protein